MGTELERIDGNPQGLISLALERQADPKVLEKLMELQERWENNHARKAYIAAMTGFKQEVPAVLKKTDRVDFTSAKGRTAYNYANLGSIVQEITACLGKHELSASWSTEQKGNDVTVTCHITHGAGYRESVTLTGPIDESGNKNRIQAVGSTVTYLQRYTLLAALGLATGEDDDGNRGERGRPTMRPPEEKKQETDPGKASQPQQNAIHAILGKLNVPKDLHYSYVSDKLGIDAISSMGQLNKDQASQVIKLLGDIQAAAGQPG